MEKPQLDFAGRMRRALKLDGLPPTMRRVLVGVIGGTLLLIGIAMVVLPGPAIVVVPIAMGILATEFVWAKRYLRKAKVLYRSAKSTIARRPGAKA